MHARAAVLWCFLHFCTRVQSLSPTQRNMSSGRGGGRHPFPFPKGYQRSQPVLRHASEVSAQNWLTGELCVAVSPISWERNLNLCGSPRSSSESLPPSQRNMSMSLSPSFRPFLPTLPQPAATQRKSSIIILFLHLFELISKRSSHCLCRTLDLWSSAADTKKEKKPLHNHKKSHCLCRTLHLWRNAADTKPT